MIEHPRTHAPFDNKIVLRNSVSTDPGQRKIQVRLVIG